MPAHRGEVVASRDALQVIDCTECGWAHLDPLPSAADQSAYYAGHFWEETKAGWLARYEAQREWIDATNGDHLAALGVQTVGCTNIDLLDIGSGYGWFMEMARSMGWRPLGIEPSESASQYATKHWLTVHQGTWENFDHPKLPQFKFTAISAMWLMEHLPNPLAFLHWCRAHLRPGGALLLAVPNEFTWMQAMAGQVASVPAYWVHPTHLNYWSGATFGNLLGRAGFRVVDKLNTFDIEGYLANGRDYTADESIGAACHAQVRAAELAVNRGIRLIEKRTRGKLGIGRDLVWIAKAD